MPHCWKSHVAAQVQVGMCAQGRFESVCAFAQSDLSLSFQPEETLDPWLPNWAPIKDSDKTAWKRRLIIVFVGGTCQLVPFARYWLVLYPCKAHTIGTLYCPVGCWYIVVNSKSIDLLSCKPRVTMTSCFVYKVIRDLESIDQFCIYPIRRVGLIHKWSVDSR